MSVKVRIIDRDGLEQKIQAMGAINWTAIVKNQLAEMFNRGRTLTPVSTEATRPGGPHGELKKSRGVNYENMGTTQANGRFFYGKHYAPHVEFGHRTRGGGYVKGQYYLRRNVEQQKPRFEKAIKEALRNAK